MPENHVREIEKVAVSLGSLKAMLGMSPIEDSDWEHVSSILDEFSFRLTSSAAGVRAGIQERDCNRRAAGKTGETHLCCGNGCGSH